jgi:hypothetical protein
VLQLSTSQAGLEPERLQKRRGLWGRRSSSKPHAVLQHACLQRVASCHVCPHTNMRGITSCPHPNTQVTYCCNNQSSSLMKMACSWKICQGTSVPSASWPMVMTSFSSLLSRCVSSSSAATISPGNRIYS